MLAMDSWWRAALAALLVSLTGCSGGSDLLLTVDLRTDYEPGTEFGTVETELRPEGASEDRTRIVRYTVAAGDDFLGGERIAETELDEAGSYVVTTTLRRADGRRLASRVTRVRVEESLALTVLLTRSCGGVSCPGPGDPDSATACLGGRCVDPACSADRPESCGGPECAADADCDPAVACAQATCSAEGYCLQRGVDAECGDGERCNLGRGCVSDAPTDGGSDAGVDGGSDAGVDGGDMCVPTSESCNGADDDCDGAVDETFDLATDDRNCGSCGHQCESWELCTGGECVLDESTLASNYCPAEEVERRSAAVFLVRTEHGRDYEPPDATGVFDDVPASSMFAPYIEKLYRDDVISGCTATTFCPTDSLTRAQMAVLLVRLEHGGDYEPPDATGVFDDVPPDGLFAPYIEQLYRDGVVSGCSATMYCPDDPVTRGQMAAFLLRYLHGGDYTPPPATGDLFDDVSAGGFFSDWIEQLAREGITTGC
ncbi:MAG: S-layer homology domain-containing protein [Gemmatimonadota bacterium]